MIRIYTDGGCSGNPKGEAAWAALWTWEEGPRLLRFDRMGVASNNAAEIRAVIEAVRPLPPNTSAEVVSDSMYVVGTVTLGWHIGANEDLWEELFSLLAFRQLRFRHVRGHSGDAGNELVDWAVNLCLGRKLDRRRRAAVAAALGLGEDGVLDDLLAEGRRGLAPLLAGALP